MKNEYEIRGDITAIFLYSPKYGKMEALISTQKLEKAKSMSSRWFPFWSKANKTFYVRASKTVNGKKRGILLHRLVSETSDNMMVDHFNHDTLNNTDGNLRNVTMSGNSQNRMGAKSSSLTGVRGVHWEKKKKRYFAYCRVDGKTKGFGRYKTLKEAEIAAINGRIKYFPFTNENAKVQKLL